MTELKGKGEVIETEINSDFLDHAHTCAVILKCVMRISPLHIVDIYCTLILGTVLLYVHSM